MIGLIGVCYKTAPVEIREQFAVAKNEINAFAEFLQTETGICDLVVLSTCNRTEIYFSQDIFEFETAALKVYRSLKHFKGVQEKRWHLFYSHKNEAAVQHLFRVASGLQSMVIGEDQIISQLKEAYDHCTEAALTDAILMRLFQKSFETSKRVRTETEIKMGATSISSAAVQKCYATFDFLPDQRILLIGAGETGNLVLQSLHKNKVHRIAVSNRTAEKAANLAAKYHCTVLPFEQMPAHLYLYDIVIIATGSKTPLINREMLELSVQKRQGKFQMMIDISVPRNIDAEVTDLSNLQLFTIDDLEEVVSTSIEKRLGNVDAANEIIDESVAEFSEWWASRSLRPAIKNITNHLSEITQTEVLNYQKAKTSEMQEAIDEFSKHITQKFTRMFITNLKEMTSNGKNIESLKFVNDLFNLSEKE